MWNILRENQHSIDQISWGGNIQSKALKRDQKKMNAWGTKTVHSTDITVSCQKRLNKKMALRIQFQILILV